MKKFFLIFFVVFFFPTRPLKAAGLELEITSSNPLYSTQSGTLITNAQTTLTITGQTNTLIDSGSIQVLLFAAPTAANLEPTADGIADIGSYDLGALTSTDVSCPTNSGAFTFNPIAKVASASSALHAYTGGFYHLITCSFTTPNPALLNFGLSGSAPLIINKLINPILTEVASSNTSAWAPIWVQITDMTDGLPLLTNATNLQSQRTVQQLAAIAPQIKVELSGLPQNTATCGITTHQTTTSATANFGTITSTAFTDLAQRLSITTNVDHGYVVTIQIDDQMRTKWQGYPPVICSGNGAGNPNCLPAAQVVGMNALTSLPWTDLNKQGLAYTQALITADDPDLLTFDHHDGYRHFPDAQDNVAPQAILNTDFGRGSQSDLCYRLIATPYNLDGGYSNQIIYTATATF